MSATSVYRQFLAAPNPSLLAANATLHYITTTTSFHGPTEIIKHLNAQRNQLKKENEELLDVVEGSAALAAEVDTKLEFVTSGGAYLPGLDDNFLCDRTVQVPIMHIVNFDAEGKIAQIRQTWDQGSLLKQLDVIGKSGRNWPIRDSREQVKLITQCLKANGKVAAAAPDTNDRINRARGSSQNVLRDPHASLSLFASREEREAMQEAPQAVVSPYAGTRPQQRSFTDILGGAPADPASPSAGRDRAVPPKIGAGKNFQPSRLFEADEHASFRPDSPDNNRSPERSAYRPHPKKYHHFEFADGSDPRDAEVAAAPVVNHRPRSAKHNSNWSFEDFTTPSKPQASKAYRHQDVRHWDNDGQDDDVATDQQPVHKPRRDAEPHFEFVDDGLPSGEPRRPGRPKGAGQNIGSHLYENNIYSEDGSAPTPSANRPLGNITNLSDRRKDFDAHFAMADNSPSAGTLAAAKISDDRKKAVNMMNSNWSSYDQSPAPQKENKPQPAKAGNDQGIHISGDGMGGRKGANRDWLYGGGGDEEDTPKPAGKKSTAASKDFWDF